jgi:hypothetical protein
MHITAAVFINDDDERGLHADCEPFGKLPSVSFGTGRTGSGWRRCAADCTQPLMHPPASAGTQAGGTIAPEKPVPKESEGTTPTRT